MSAPGLASATGAEVYGAGFRVDSAHRLTAATFRESPHQDQRPDAGDISLLVIHAISLPPGEFAATAPAPDAPHSTSIDKPANPRAANAATPPAPRTTYIDDLFLGQLNLAAHPYFETLRGLRVSAHLCIFRDGSITQYVPFNRRAWHAGASQFGGRERCNDYSIGIELEGCDEQPFTAAQYLALTAATQTLLHAYPAITRERITGHSDIAPGRKTDPGPHFDWPRFLGSLPPGLG